MTTVKSSTLFIIFALLSGCSIFETLIVTHQPGSYTTTPSDNGKTLLVYMPQESTEYQYKDGQMQYEVGAAVYELLPRQLEAHFQTIEKSATPCDKTGKDACLEVSISDFTAEIASFGIPNRASISINYSYYHPAENISGQIKGEAAESMAKKLGGWIPAGNDDLLNNLGTVMSKAIVMAGEEIGKKISG